MLSIGDFIKHRDKNICGMIIAAKKANQDLLCKAIHNKFMVYYVLLNSGDIEGPLFYSEISQM
jgi:hypothetical protein